MKKESFNSTWVQFSSIYKAPVYNNGHLTVLYILKTQK